MTLSVAEPWLSASINAPAAWAAFSAITQLSWSLRVTTWSPFKLDVVHDYDFQTCLDEAGSFAFDKRARGEIALRILTIADDFDERRLKVRRISVETLRTSNDALQKALEDLKSAIISRVRQELHYRFDTRPQTWADRAKALTSTLPADEGRQLSRYLGLDQELTERQCVAGLNYAFCTLQPAIQRTREGVSLTGHERKLKEARAARNDTDPKARARNLAVRAIEARISSMQAQDEFGEILLDLALDDLLPILRDDLRNMVKLQGCWGLIDLTIRRDRVETGSRLPVALPPEVWDLVRQQELRIDEVDEGPKS